MTFLRRIIEDRQTGGLFGVLLALSFAIQTLIVGWSSAAMAAPDPLSVLCVSEQGAHRPADGHHQDCPCSTLCHAGVHVQSLLAPVDDTGLPIRFSVFIDEPVDVATPLSAIVDVRRYDAQGPPA
ncbi:hypothetical protein ASG25_08645 [Rhizobium sp. Leaf384]|uniref:hypothetical protein n=1 Tax=unclassified Rhizobium TaxID=2613769 RepID=UPI000714AB26|nr:MULTISPECIES: hypothetical protein [unclassified Rhizobium]KQR71649.1 hypothetical protein ASG03_04035 [Rhizobium sp. Leaf341]KQS75365.1 hypothetical protein ASG58_14815 [Rhizobium sp. Leaf383]KQS78719.1 hypothetical protein ASG25_08645 [Rhizobium sp. Leaf384]